MDTMKDMRMQNIITHNNYQYPYNVQVARHTTRNQFPQKIAEAAIR